MLRKGTLHLREANARMDGTFNAVTLMNSPPHGVMVWAGKLRASARDKGAAEVEASDYLSLQKVSFSRWMDVWDYFAEPEYAELVARLRIDVESLYPGE